MAPAVAKREEQREKRREREEKRKEKKNNSKSHKHIHPHSTHSQHTRREFTYIIQVFLVVKCVVAIEACQCVEQPPPEPFLELNHLGWGVLVLCPSVPTLYLSGRREPRCLHKCRKFLNLDQLQCVITGHRRRDRIPQSTRGNAEQHNCDHDEQTNGATLQTHACVCVCVCVWVSVCARVHARSYCQYAYACVGA